MRGLVTDETRGAGARSDLAALLRRHDRDRFQTALFAPAARRHGLFALYAFNFEIARVREIVTEPMLGRIRLEWWRETIEAAFEGGPVRHHPVATALAATIAEFALTRAPLDRLVDSRERDILDEPPPSLPALEAYAEDSSAGLVALALEVLGVRSPGAAGAARGVGIGYALAGLLRAMPFHARAGRCYLPAEIAGRAGLDPADYAALRGSPALRATVAELADRAAQQLRGARERRAAVPRSARAALLPAVIAERFLARLKAAGYNPFDGRLAAPDPLQSWRLAAAALFGRF